MKMIVYSSVDCGVVFAYSNKTSPFTLCVYETFFSHFFTIFCIVWGICFASFYSKSIELKHTSIPLDRNLGHFATLEVFQVTNF